MGFNHMNGRVQDAITGRFLSPDPNVPDPTNPQDYNRYTYVDNNPLTYIDPTGLDDQSNDGGCVVVPFGYKCLEITVTPNLLPPVPQWQTVFGGGGQLFPQLCGNSVAFVRR